MNLSIGIIFCFLILRQQPGTGDIPLWKLVKVSDERMGQGRLCLLPQDSPEKRTHPHRAKATGGQKREFSFHGSTSCRLSFLASFALFFLGIPKPEVI